MIVKISLKNVSLKKKINIKNVKLGIKKVFPELEDLEITPSGKVQNFKSEKYGYDNITVKAVASDEITIVPSIEDQIFEGLFGTVNVEAIKVPSEQWYEKEAEIWI